MATIGNSLAFGLLILISFVFFRTKYYLTKASEYYRICLILALVTAAFNTLRLETVRLTSTPAWLSISLTTLEFVLVIVLTSMMAVYFAAKVVDHILTKDKLVFATVYLGINAAVFLAALIGNITGGYIFSVSADGSFVDGPLSFLPYLIVIPQFILVGIYCIRYRKVVNKKVLLALIESILAIAFLLIIKFLYDISVLGMTIAFIQLIFLLDFQRQKMGVNSVTKISDNRSFFSELEKRRKANRGFTAYLIWIENIRKIKQTYGHNIGDEVLYHFAHSLEQRFLDAAAFHMYGTNFTLVIDEDCVSADYTDDIISFLDEGVRVDKRVYKLKYIIAQHTWSDAEISIDTFYEKLEHAAMVAKDRGEQLITYDDQIEAARLRQDYLIRRMNTVSSAEGFETWFQPVFSNNKNKFTSMEVLLRLKEKDGSFISPAEFIPLAEKTGQITAITWFVIDQTCSVLAKHRELDDLRVSINLPMLQLADPLFDDKLNKIVDSYKIPHERISFEFTERVILEDLDVAEKNMRRLAESGYTFYLDDFGVGYSNFNCVLRLPLRAVKLDRSLTLADGNHKLVSILTDLFHDMELKVVAEGVESEDQVKMLRSHNVDAIQGYYYARPMPLSSLIPFIASRDKL